LLIQLALGSGLMLVTILIAGISVWVMEWALIRFDPWLRRRPHRPKLLLMIAVAALWVLLQLTAGVWIWALTFNGLALFENLETSVYFTLVTYTTLGFGDVLLPLEWRLLAGMASANGLVSMGLLTAVLVELVRQVRVLQAEAVRDDPRR
jgi:hypothetical protein